MLEIGGQFLVTLGVRSVPEEKKAGVEGLWLIFLPTPADLLEAMVVVKQKGPFYNFWFYPLFPKKTSRHYQTTTA